MSCRVVSCRDCDLSRPIGIQPDQFMVSDSAGHKFNVFIKMWNRTHMVKIVCIDAIDQKNEAGMAKKQQRDRITITDKQLILPPEIYVVSTLCPPKAGCECVARALQGLFRFGPTVNGSVHQRDECVRSRLLKGNVVCIGQRGGGREGRWDRCCS